MLCTFRTFDSLNANPMSAADLLRSSLQRWGSVTKASAAIATTIPKVASAMTYMPIKSCPQDIEKEFLSKRVNSFDSLEYRPGLSSGRFTSPQIPVRKLLSRTDMHSQLNCLNLNC